jgi:hypothetical protein
LYIFCTYILYSVILFFCTFSAHTVYTLWFCSFVHFLHIPFVFCDFVLLYIFCTYCLYPVILFVWGYMLCTYRLLALAFVLSCGWSPYSVLSVQLLSAAVISLQCFVSTVAVCCYDLPTVFCQYSFCLLLWSPYSVLSVQLLSAAGVIKRPTERVCEFVHHVSWLCYKGNLCSFFCLHPFDVSSCSCFCRDLWIAFAVLTFNCYLILRLHTSRLLVTKLPKIIGNMQDTWSAGTCISSKVVFLQLFFFKRTVTAL